MKRIFGCFLFRKHPDPQLSAVQKVIFWAWNWILLLGAVLVLGLASLGLAPGLHSWALFLDYLRHPGILALNLLPPIVLAVLIYGISGRTWIAYLVTAIPVLLLSVGNFYKLAFRDDPVVAADMTILRTAQKIMDKYPLFWNNKVALVLAAGIISVVLLVLFARGVPKKWWSRTAIAVVPVIAAILLYPTYKSDRVYSRNENYEHIRRWSATDQYVSRGLIYPFIHSIKDAVRTPPEGYNQKEVNALLAQYEDADIPEDKKVNIVGIMLEAFADFSQFPQVEMAQDIYADYHTLEAESYTGNLLTNIFAGGTINTERAFLSGISTGDHNYRSATNSYVWYLRSQGYRATGNHPCFSWFYNRPNVNEYLGFEWYRFADDYYVQFVGEGSVAYDDVFFPELTRSVLEQMESDAPLFSFSVNYQGHGPYSGDTCRWGDVDEFVVNHNLNEESRTILANYLGSVQNTQHYLMGMVETLRQSDEPVVLVVFGDHKPWLGNSNSVYSALGIDFSMSDTQSYYNYWSTRYLFWANDKAKEVLGNNFVGVGPDVSPCFLMNVLFDQCGWEGDAYMQAVNECMAALPVISTQGFCLTSDGALTKQLDTQQQALADRFAMLEYDRATRFTSERKD